MSGGNDTRTSLAGLGATVGERSCWRIILFAELSFENDTDTAQPVCVDDSEKLETQLTNARNTAIRPAECSEFTASTL